MTLILWFMPETSLPRSRLDETAASTKCQQLTLGLLMLMPILILLILLIVIQALFKHEGYKNK